MGRRLSPHLGTANAEMKPFTRMILPLFILVCLPSLTAGDGTESEMEKRETFTKAQCSTTVRKVQESGKYTEESIAPICSEELRTEKCDFFSEALSIASSHADFNASHFCQTMDEARFCSENMDQLLTSLPVGDMAYGECLRAKPAKGDAYCQKFHTMLSYAVRNDDLDTLRSCYMLEAYTNLEASPAPEATAESPKMRIIAGSGKELEGVGTGTADAQASPEAAPRPSTVGQASIVVAPTPLEDFGKGKGKIEAGKPSSIIVQPVLAPEEEGQAATATSATAAPSTIIQKPQKPVEVIIQRTVPARRDATLAVVGTSVAQGTAQQATSVAQGSAQQPPAQPPHPSTSGAGQQPPAQPSQPATSVAQVAQVAARQQLAKSPQSAPPQPRPTTVAQQEAVKVVSPSAEKPKKVPLLAEAKALVRITADVPAKPSTRAPKVEAPKSPAVAKSKPLVANTTNQIKNVAGHAVELHVEPLAPRPNGTNATNKGVLAAVVATGKAQQIVKEAAPLTPVVGHVKLHSVLAHSGNGKNHSKTGLAQATSNEYHGFLSGFVP